MTEATMMPSRKILDDKSVFFSLIACAVIFGIFLGWGALAKLDEGVTASGQVVVEQDRKSIQHFEGGIIRQMNIREGDMVDQGAVLMDLEPIQSESQRVELAQEYAIQAATLDRLIALRSDQPAVAFASLQAVDLPGPVRTDIITRQQALFREQRAARAAELTVLETRMASLQGRQRDLANQISATQRQLSTARSDLRMRQQMMNEKLETIGNVQQVAREVASVESQLSRLVGERNEAIKSEQEVADQVIEAKARVQEEISQQIVDAQTKSLAARERLLALEDRVARTVIRAPLRGTVLNLAHTTIGGVVSPGEVIMEIVPETGDLIVSVRLKPGDREAVTPGQEVKATLSAYKQFKAPQLDGEVINVSADLKLDETSGVYYYEAKVKLDRTGLAEWPDVKVVPGMPVDAFIKSPVSRSFFDYVFEPIKATFTRGTRMG